MDISKEELYKAIGTKIRAMRTAKGWTQEELGNKFDVSSFYYLYDSDATSVSSSHGA